MKHSPRYRIAVVSEDLAEPWDEGIKKFTHSVAEVYKHHHDVLVINVDRSGVGPTNGIAQVPGTRTFFGGALKRAVGDFKPHWILYVPSPSNTLSSNARAVILSRQARVSVVMVALIPRPYQGWRRHAVKALAPALTLVPSYASLLRLNRLGISGAVLPVGVDLTEFRRPTPQERAESRARLGLRDGKFVFLHVGHTRPRRNVVALTALAEQRDVEIISISSTSTPESPEVRARLDQAGVRVVREFVKVSDYYRAADCYVFPVHDAEGCVEMPLSVLEALACGLPVLTTPFGGLPDFFYAGDDLMYWRTEQELVAAADHMKTRVPATTRAMDEFSWERIAQSILEHAEAL